MCAFESSYYVTYFKNWYLPGPPVRLDYASNVKRPPPQRDGERCVVIKCALEGMDQTTTLAKIR